jgi:hypothetical protein
LVECVRTCAGCLVSAQLLGLPSQVASYRRYHCSMHAGPSATARGRVDPSLAVTYTYHACRQSARGRGRAYDPTTHALAHSSLTYVSCGRTPPAPRSSLFATHPVATDVRGTARIHPSTALAIYFFTFFCGYFLCARARGNPIRGHSCCIALFSSCVNSGSYLYISSMHACPLAS